MKISMYSACVPVFTSALGNMDRLLEKAMNYVVARKLDPNALLLARLAPDMYPLKKQVQVATDLIKGTAARLAGVEVPKYEDNETTFEELRQRVAKTLAFLGSLQPAQFEGAEDRDIILNLGGQPQTFKGETYLLSFGTPNVYFHYVTIYALLRHNGMELSKRDYIGPLR